MPGILASLRKGVRKLTAPTEIAPAPAALLQVRSGLPNVLPKLNGGGEVRIAYLGGSITSAHGWRPKSLEWFRWHYPAAKIIEIDAAIPGTGSDLGVHRLRPDVLRHRPDLIFVEFSVNDLNATTANIFRSMEGIVRQAWHADPSIDFCFVYTFRPDYADDLARGRCSRAPSVHEAIAEYYGIPSINTALRVVQLEREGRLIFQSTADEAPEGKLLFSHDGIHPLDAGHEIYAGVIADAIASLPPNPSPLPHVIPPALNADNWEAAHLVPLSAAALSPGWEQLNADSPEVGQFGKFLPEIWRATVPGESLSFKFRGTMAQLYDLVAQDGGQIRVTVDGVVTKTIPRFDRWANRQRLATVQIAEGLPDTLHTVHIELLAEQPDRGSVTEVEKHKPDFDPAVYDGTVLRAGAILLLGEIVS